MRLFTAIDLNDETRKRIIELLADFQPTAPLLWSPSHNLHITTKFIGEVPESDLPKIITALSSIPASRPFDIALSGLGWYPNPHQPRSFWLGVRSTDALPVLAKATNDALVPLGVARESKPFSPHLTLARVRIPGVELRTLRSAIARLPSIEFGHFTATSFHLYLSELSSTGSRYIKLAEFPFAL